MCIGVGALLTNGSLAWLKTPVSKGKKPTQDMRGTLTPLGYSLYSEVTHSQEQ